MVPKVLPEMETLKAKLERGAEGGALLQDHGLSKQRGCRVKGLLCGRVREDQDPQHGQRGRQSIPTIICKSFLQVFKQVGVLDHHLVMIQYQQSTQE